MAKSRGLRTRTRSRFSKKARARGLPSTNRTIARFSPGEKVVINIEPSIHKGQPYKRADGKTGEVIGQQGAAYTIRVREGNTYMTVLSLPVHLKKIGG